MRATRRPLSSLLAVSLFLFALLALAATLSAPAVHSEAVITTISVGVGPVGAAYDSGKGEVFVSNWGSGTVSVISDTTNVVIATVTVGTYPYGVAYDSGKGEVFVSNWGSGTVSVISDTTNVVIATVTVGIYPYGVAYDSGKGEVFVCNWGSNTVSVISDATNTVVATVHVGSLPIGAAYDSALGEVFVTNYSSGTVSVISDATNTVVATVHVGSFPIGLAYDSGKAEVYVANDGAGTVSVVSDATNTVTATVTVGTNPFGVSYDSGKGEVYVANDGSNTVSVISDAANTVSVELTVGTNPRSSAYDFGKGEVFVTNWGSNLVSVISDSAPPPTTTSTTTSTSSTTSTGSTTITSSVTSTVTSTTTITSTISLTSSTTIVTSTIPVTTTITTTVPISSSVTTITTTTVLTSTSTVVTTCAINCAPTTLTVSCAAVSVGIGAPDVCTATVQSLGSTPTGTVAWSVNPSSSGGLNSATCLLSNYYAFGGYYSTCSVIFTPSAPPGSPVVLTASYGGDAQNSASSGTVNLIVILKTTTTTIVCTPRSAVAGSATVITCTAKVIGNSPTGIVSWTQSGIGSVSFGATTCTIAPYTCSVTMTGATAGGVRLVASYGGDSNNRGSSRLVVVTIAKVPTSVAVSCSPSSLRVGSVITCTMTVSGAYSAQTGTAIWSKISGRGGIAFHTRICPLSSGSCAVTLTVIHSGSFTVRATYSGDSNNLRSWSNLLNKASPTITPFLSSTAVAQGQAVTDAAVLNGGFNAGGFASYEYFSGNACSGPATPVGFPWLVVNSLIPSSSPQIFVTVGSYSWNVVYSGDANNNGATSPCQSLIVNSPGVSILTTLSATSIIYGSSVTDSASLSGGTSTAGGTVTYEFFSGGYCSGVPTTVGTPVVVLGRSIPTSYPQTFGSSGPYSWNAVYSGDAQNNGATSPCEPLTVMGSTITLTLSSSSITVGGSVTASSTLTGITSTAGGTVTYQYFAGNTCSGTAITVGIPVAVINGVIPNSASQQFGAVGIYSWNAVYSGDSNNNGAASTCQILTVNVVTVTTTVTSAFTSSLGSAIQSAMENGDTHRNAVEATMSVPVTVWLHSSYE